eukprot:Gb_02900 [translate_table: standard]
MMYNNWSICSLEKGIITTTKVCLKHVCKDDDKGKGGESPRSHELPGRHLLPDSIREPLQLLGSYRFSGRCFALPGNAPSTCVIKEAKLWPGRRATVAGAVVGHSGLNTWHEFIVIPFEESHRIAKSKDIAEALGFYDSSIDSLFGVLAYLQAPVLFLPYPIIIEMLRRFDNGAFWFFDKVVPIEAPLINQITGWPQQGHEIDPKEEARFHARKKEEKDLEAFSAQYYYWTDNATSFVQGPYGLPWSPQDLLVITIPKAQKQDEPSKGKAKLNQRSSSRHPKPKSLVQGHFCNDKGPAEELGERVKYDQGTSRSPNTSIGVVATMPLAIPPLTSLPPFFLQSVRQELPLSHWGQNLSRTEQTQELPEDIVPSPTLKKIREKRKGRFNHFVCIIDGALTTCLDVASWKGNYKVEDDLGPTGGRRQATIDPRKAQYFHNQRANSKGDRRPLECSNVHGSSIVQASNIALATGHQEDIIGRRVFMKRETAFQRQMRATQLTQRSKSLIGNIENMLEDTLQFAGFERQEGKLAHLSEKRTGSEMILYQPPLVIPSLLVGTSTQGLPSVGPGPGERQASSIRLPSSNNGAFLLPHLIEKAPPSMLLESVERLLESVGPLIDHIEIKAASTLRREIIKAMTIKPIPLSQFC